MCVCVCARARCAVQRVVFYPTGSKVCRLFRKPPKSINCKDQLAFARKITAENKGKDNCYATVKDALVATNLDFDKCPSWYGIAVQGCKSDDVDCADQLAFARKTAADYKGKNICYDTVVSALFKKYGLNTHTCYKNHATVKADCKSDTTTTTTPRPVDCAALEKFAKDKGAANNSTSSGQTEMEAFLAMFKTICSQKPADAAAFVKVRENRRKNTLF